MPSASVLIVEDESIIALDIRTSLESSGYRVVAIAANAEDAIARVTEFKPDIVLMDIQLQGDRDGIATAEQIHRDFNLPVIYLTAHADEKTLSRAKRTEPFGYILKPFEDQELVTAIEIALSRHQAETAVHFALQREKELNELKSRFVSVVSHEFRNPLNAILFSTELIQRYGNQLTDEKRTIYLERIQESVQRMSTLLTDVLIIGETESGKLKFSPQSVDLIQFCETVIDQIRLGEKQYCNIIFTHSGLFTLPVEAFALQGSPNSSKMIGSAPDLEALPKMDERLMRYILSNLLSNAIKYSQPGQSIEFDVTCDRELAIFKIQDYGLGIPKADLAHLFQSFHRASNVQSIPGTGLGLSIVKQCVDLHGGTITVESEEGRGTLFTVTLPLNRVIHEENPSH
jgi:signal transduction histidine kinase